MKRAAGLRIARRPAGAGTIRQRQPRHEESDLQISLVSFYNSAVRPLGQTMLFAVPNGGARDAITGGILMAEGVRSGVADLVLLINGGRTVFIEVKLDARDNYLGKRKKTHLHEGQREFRDDVQRLGFSYFVVRSLPGFVFLLDELGVAMRARPAGCFGQPPADVITSS